MIPALLSIIVLLAVIVLILLLVLYNEQNKSKCDTECEPTEFKSMFNEWMTLKRELDADVFQEKDKQAHNRKMIQGEK